MKISTTDLEEALVFEPTAHGDDRGFFMETFRQDAFNAVVPDIQFVQDNHSKSRRGVLRGLHYQIEKPQGKLIRVISGAVYDVIVDLRRLSATFCQWQGIYLSSENKKILWAPPGFAHGFYVCEEETEFVYKCTNYYSPQHERTLLWNDPGLGVEWPVPDGEQPLLSEKDRCGTELEHAELFD